MALNTTNTALSFSKARRLTGTADGQEQPVLIDDEPVLLSGSDLALTVADPIAQRIHRRGIRRDLVLRQKVGDTGTSILRVGPPRIRQRNEQAAAALRAACRVLGAIRIE